MHFSLRDKYHYSATNLKRRFIRSIWQKIRIVKFVLLNRRMSATELEDFFFNSNNNKKRALNWQYWLHMLKLIILFTFPIVV